MERELSFEYDKERKLVEVHANLAGLRLLKDKIDKLLDSSGNDHDHLMIESWGGGELTNQKHSDEVVVVPHVKIYKWDELSG